MGVDWIPCRAEAACSADELYEHVRREAIHFRASGSSSATMIDHRISFSEAEREQIRRDYLELGPLHCKLLFKQESHRIYVISWEELFPIEWRLAAERTILPWELRDQLAEWQGYREEVRRGRHRSFLQRLYTYTRLRELLTVDVANLASVVEHSRTATGSWAKRPEVVACADELLAEPILTLPPLPQWPGEQEDADLSIVELAFARVDTAVSAWNNAVQRGNYKAHRPKLPPTFEEWIATRLNDEWYSSFLKWVEPWKRGGYGLYRDCE